MNNSNNLADIYAEQILTEERAEKIDEDGYAIGDPYADAAKMVDRMNKNKSYKKKFAEVIVEN